MTKQRNIQRKAPGMILVVLLIAILSGCPAMLMGPDGSRDGDGNRDSVDQTAATSGITVTVPNLAPWLAEGLASIASSSGGIRPSAYAVTDMVELIVFDGPTEIGYVSFERELTGETSTFTGSVVVPAGTGYSLTVNIYNLAVSNVDPVVSGTVGDIVVEAGSTTSVPVRCTPVSPRTLSTDTPENFSVVPFVLDADGFPISNGGEVWFSFAAPASGYAEFSVDLGPDESFLVALFYEDGSMVQEYSLYGNVYSGPMAVSGLTPAATYYGAVVMTGPTSDLVNRSLTMTEIAPQYLSDTEVPDAELRQLMEWYTGKEFATDTNPTPADQITNLDLEALTSLRTDGYDGGPVLAGIADLKGIEYCSNLGFLLLNNNDLGAAANLTRISELGNLNQLDAYYCNLQDLGFLSGMAQLSAVKIVGNPDLGLSDLLSLSSSSFPNLTNLHISAWDSDSDGFGDFANANDWTDLVAMLADHQDLFDLSLDGFMNSDAMFNELYASVLGPKSGQLLFVLLGGNQITGGALANLANLSNLQDLNLERNTALTDISWVTGLTDLRAIQLSETGITDITPLQTLHENGGLREEYWGYTDVDIRGCSSLDLTEGGANGDALTYLLHNGVRVESDATWVSNLSADWEYMFDGPAGAHGITYDGTDLWVVARDEDMIYRISATDGSVQQSFSSPTGNSSGTGLTYDGSSLWYAHDNGYGPELWIYQIDPANGDNLGRIQSPATGDSTGLTWDGSYLWVTGFGEQYYKFGTDGAVADSLEAIVDDAEGLAWANGYLWSQALDGTVRKIDPTTGAVQYVGLSEVGGGLGLTFDGTYLWMSGTDGGFYRLDVSGL